MKEQHETIGRVNGVSGAQVMVALDHASGDGEASGVKGPAVGLPVNVGELVKIKTSQSLVFGLIARLSSSASADGTMGYDRGLAEVDLVGEVVEVEGDNEVAPFERGVSIHPPLVSVCTIIEGAILTLFERVEGRPLGRAGEVSHGRQRVKPLRGSSASLRPFG